MDWKDGIGERSLKWRRRRSVDRWEISWFEMWLFITALSVSWIIFILFLPGPPTIANGSTKRAIYPCLHLHVRCSANWVDESTGLASSSISWGLGRHVLIGTDKSGPSFCYDRLSVSGGILLVPRPHLMHSTEVGVHGVESRAMMNMIGAFVVRFRHIMFIASICLLKFWADTGV